MSEENERERIDIVQARFKLRIAKHYGRSNLEFLSQVSNSGYDISNSDFERVLAYNMIKDLSPVDITTQNIYDVLEAEDVLLSLTKQNDFTSRNKRTSIPKEPINIGNILDYTRGE